MLRKTPIKPKKMTRAEKIAKRARIKAKKEALPAVVIYDDGREVCQKNSAGQKEYANRRIKMYIRDKGICCICKRKIYRIEEATFEHWNGRGAGKHDDRIEIDGKPFNGVAHLLCNQYKGSRPNGSVSPDEVIRATSTSLCWGEKRFSHPNPEK